VEQILKFVMFGWKRYVFEKANIYDGVITLALVVRLFKLKIFTSSSRLEI
jgi:hypothetical protein